MLLNYRELKIVDAEKIRKWRNNQIKILRQNEKIKKKDQVIYFKKHILLKNPKLDLFAIDLDQKLVGYAGLVNISNHFKTAEVSFIINDKSFCFSTATWILFDFFESEGLGSIDQ